MDRFDSATARSASAFVRCTRERWCGEAPSGDRKTKRSTPGGLGGAQQAPGGDAVDLLDRRLRLVALRGGEVDDGLDAAQGVAEGRRVAEVAERDLHPHALRAEPPRVAHQAADRLARGRPGAAAAPTRPARWPLSARSIGPGD